MEPKRGCISRGSTALRNIAAFGQERTWHQSIGMAETWKLDFGQSRLTNVDAGAERFHDTETDRAKKWQPIMLENRTDSKAGGGLSRGINTRSRELRKRPKGFSL